MNKLLLSAVVLVLSACGSTGAPRAAPAADDPHALVASGALLLDVRTVGEYEARHLDGARLIPVDELAARIDEVPRDHPVVVYCRSGGRSGRAAQILRGAGYDVTDLGPMDAW